MSLTVAEKKALEAARVEEGTPAGRGDEGAAVKGPMPLPPGDGLMVKTPAPPGGSPFATLSKKNGDATKGTAKDGALSDDDSAVLILGCAQVCLGVLMAACGVLALAHGAALAGAGAGLWGGAAAMAAGAAALLAGLRGCWDGGRSRALPDASHPPPPALAAALALALVALAVAHLAAVLAVAGLVRDVRNPPPMEEKVVFFEADEAGSEQPELRWPPLLANAGLLAVAALECVCGAAAALRCARRVCPCASRRRQEQRRGQQRARSPPGSDDSGGEHAGSFYSTGSKERLVARWLGAPPPPPPLPALATPAGRTPPPYLLYSSQPVGASVFAMPPPPPMLSFPLPPPGAPGAVHRFLNPLAAPPRYRVRRPHHLSGAPRAMRSRRPGSAASSEERRARDREARRARRAAAAVAATAAAPAPAPPRAPTDEEICRTYTGLDREIAEEFIAIAMEPGAARERQARSNSDTMSTESTRLSDK